MGIIELRRECSSACRVWVEQGFRALKSLGWHWERTRRTDLDRIARHWLVLAMSVIILLAVGSDYNLLLVSRFKEEISGGLKTGIIRAMAGTGSMTPNESSRPACGRTRSGRWCSARCR